MFPFHIFINELCYIGQRLGRETLVALRILSYSDNLTLNEQYEIWMQDLDQKFLLVFHDYVGEAFVGDYYMYPSIILCMQAGV